MESFKDKVREAAEFVGRRISDRISDRITGTPRVGVLAGTGLGAALDKMDDVVCVDYKTIPHFPLTTVVTHEGRFLFGKMGAKSVLAMQGRFHHYEGYSMEDVTLPIRVMRLLGAETLIVSNAAGGIDPSFKPGDIMLIEDHINLTGNNPLVGPNIDEWGPRFPDMTQVYSPMLLEMAREAAGVHGIGIRKGVYAGLGGPSLETRAEIRFLRTIGAHAVGLSTIPEVIAAVHGGMQILGLSVITNVHDPDNPRPCSVDEIIATAVSAAPRLRAIIESVIMRLPEGGI